MVQGAGGGGVKLGWEPLNHASGVSGGAVAAARHICTRRHEIYTGKNILT